MSSSEELETTRRVRARLNPKLRAAEKTLAITLERREARRLKGLPVAPHSEFPPVSKSQQRLLRVLGLTVPERHEWARTMLHTAGYKHDGIPEGKTWQQAKYLSDEQLERECRIC